METGYSSPATQWASCSRHGPSSRNHAIATSTTPDCAEVPESVTPNIRNRSYAIAVELEIDSPEASGVLFSQGSRFGGHALYLKDGIFKYVYN